MSLADISRHVVGKSRVEAWPRPMQIVTKASLDFLESASCIEWRMLTFPVPAGDIPVADATLVLAADLLRSRGCVEASSLLPSLLRKSVSPWPLSTLASSAPPRAASCQCAAARSRPRVYASRDEGRAPAD
eukprot:scaffold2671_cov252-Pinguiococcus_pyrenoidosus.AAC.27